MCEYVLTMQARIKLTARRMPGTVSAFEGENPLESKMRCTTIAPTTEVIMQVQMRKASRYFSEELG